MVRVPAGLDILGTVVYMVWYDRTNKRLELRDSSDSATWSSATIISSADLEAPCPQIDGTLTRTPAPGGLGQTGENT